MDIRYTEERSFTAAQLEELFLSVEWESGRYPEGLYKALTTCETVITAWDGDKLVGLVNAIDDGGMTAYVHYLLVHPDYQCRRIGSTLTEMIKEKYKDYFYFFLVAEHKPLVNFYEKLGFIAMSDRTIMSISHK